MDPLQVGIPEIVQLEAEARKYAASVPDFAEFEIEYAKYISEEVRPKNRVAIPASVLFKRPAPPVTFFVPGFIYGGAINLLAGEPKAGKSTLLWHMLVALTNAKPFLGVNTTKGTVVLATEQNEFSFRENAKRVPGFDTSDGIHIIFPEKMPILAKWEDKVAFWDEELTAVGGDGQILVIDTFLPFANLPPGGENDSACIATMLSQLRCLYALRPNLSIVLVHHVRKPSVDPKALKYASKYASLRDARGSSALAGGVDHCVMLTKPNVDTTQRYVHIEGRFAEERSFDIALLDSGYKEVNSFAGLSSEGIKMPKVKQAVAVYDLHYPQYHRPTVEAVFDYIRQNPPSTFIFGGDQFHFDCISHHNANKPLYKTRRAYRNDIDGFDRDILQPLEALLPRGCKKVWIIGNHERFEQDMIEAHPELEDAIGHQNLLRLEERGWEIVPLAHAYKLGKLNVIHGEVLSGIGNQMGLFPAKKAVELYAGNVLAGHTHAPQSFTRVSPVEKSNKWQGHIAPIAGYVNPSYLRNRPTAWLNGFVIIDVQTDGQFNLYPIIVYNGTFAFAGKVYGGK